MNKQRQFFFCAILISALSVAVPLPASADTAVIKWTSNIPKDLDNSAKWMALVEAMKEKHFNYGRVAASLRILQYFADLKTKTLAYQNLVESVDAGYPFSLANDFIAGDIELNGPDIFSQTYNLYKATVNEQKNMQKWADNYFKRVDKEHFPKFLLFKAIDASKRKKPEEALTYLDKALAQAKGPEYASLAARAARTMARTYYEQTQYDKAFDIYQNYLLKLNPIEPNDWVEAAWALYRLNRFDEAIGYLFNLEGSTGAQNIFLEKYVIRALVYREKCDLPATDRLGKSFAHDFGSTIEAIKTGESLKNFALLRKVYLGTGEYYRSVKVLQEIEAERKRIDELPKELRAAAQFLYTSEAGTYQKVRDAAEEDALDAAARSLVILGESLKFLQFDVQREKFNPDKVFEPEDAAPETLVTTVSNDKFDIRWLQWGDYWRDERQLYKGRLKNRCK